MLLARWLFRLAGIYGLIVIPPQYFLEKQLGIDYPPEITHPEYFYGFVGVAAAWQVAFLVIGHDPLRHRPLMIPAVLEKMTFGIAAIVLYSQERLTATVLGFGIVDLVLGVLFFVVWWRCAPGQGNG